ncbi:MAG TPA: cytochrome c [Polyangiaceae bacterium]|nr:cytochrome c [Polyangiaceae bacterium]
MLRTKLLLGVIALWSVSAHQGCEDVKRSITHLRYYPIRDMRQTVVIDPQRRDPTHPQWLSFTGPDSQAVPTMDVDRWQGDPPYDAASKNVASPNVAMDASVVRGDTLFHNFCWTCHGMAMAGDGPVAPMFMPPPDLLAAPTRARTDGYIFMYMRHGGVVMPSYGNAISAKDAWDIVHYIRAMQKANPR